MDEKRMGEEKGERVQLEYVDSLGVSDDKLLKEVTNIARDYCYKLKKKYKYKLDFSNPRKRGRPLIHVQANRFAEAWEVGVIATLAFGSDVHTYYDQADEQGKYKHVGSREAKVILEAFKPYDKAIHKNFPGGIENLVDYAAEVIDGNKDHKRMPFEKLVELMRARKFGEIKDDPKWKYTYHERLTSYPVITPDGKVLKINQFDQILNKIKREPLSKSIQATTWAPWMDHNDINPFSDYDSPCFQRFWYRLIPFKGDRGKGYLAELDTDWRSRDLYKAVPMNVFAFLMWKKILDEKVEKELSVPIYSGRYYDHSNSNHLYGYYIDPMHPDKGEEGRKFLDEVLKMIQEPMRNKDNPEKSRILFSEDGLYQRAYLPVAIIARDDLRADMGNRGYNVKDLDYLGRENPLF